VACGEPFTNFWRSRLNQRCGRCLACGAPAGAPSEDCPVYYPGLESHAQHALAKRQMHEFGGMVTAILKGTLADAKRFLERCQIFALAESLGGVESLIEHPAIMTHASIPAEKRAELGISDGLVRLSVGIEDEADLIADLDKLSWVLQTGCFP
jgi:cystathionine gamma-lyase